MPDSVVVISVTRHHGSIHFSNLRMRATETLAAALLVTLVVLQVRIHPLAIAQARPRGAGAWSRL